MGVTQDKRKFKVTKKQSNPTNPTGNVKVDNNKFNLDRKTIKDKKTKEWWGKSIKYIVEPIELIETSKHIEIYSWIEMKNQKKGKLFIF